MGVAVECNCEDHIHIHVHVNILAMCESESRHSKRLNVFTPQILRKPLNNRCLLHIQGLKYDGF